LLSRRAPESGGLPVAHACGGKTRDETPGEGIEQDSSRTAVELELLGVDRGVRSARTALEHPVVSAAAASAPIAVALPQPVRLRSLDAFRGITIVAMILVNNPDGV
jgi:hypothetical protein